MSSSPVTAAAKSEKNITSTINAVLKLLQLYSSFTDIGGSVRLPANRSNTNDSAASASAAAVTQIFNNNGDPI